MGTGQTNTLIMASLEDLQKLIDDNLVTAKYKAMLSRFDNVLVGTKDNPSFEMIDIRDIAKGLAYKPHFSGFSPKFFSIAEHSLAVEEMIALIDKDNYHARLEALLHDASEAYTGDMIKPIKNLLPNFVMIEKKIQSTIYSKYGIQPKSYDLDIKPTDNRIQDIEAMAFYRKDADLSPFERILVEKYIKYLTPDEALKEFTARFEWLIAKTK